MKNRANLCLFFSYMHSKGFFTRRLKKRNKNKTYTIYDTQKRKHLKISHERKRYLRHHHQKKEYQPLYSSIELAADEISLDPSSKILRFVMRPGGKEPGPDGDGK